MRCEVIDIFPAESDEVALRVELFDDEVERLLLFYPLTSHVDQEVPRYTIYSKTHYVTPREWLVQAMEDIKVELAERRESLLACGKVLKEQRLSQRTAFDLEMINEVGYCSGIENYSRYLSGRVPGEPSRRCSIICRPTGLLDLQIEVRPVSTQVDDLLAGIRRRVQINERVLVTTLTKRMAEDLTEYLEEHAERVRHLHSDIETVSGWKSSAIRVSANSTCWSASTLLREGLDIPEVSLVARLNADKESFLGSERSLIQTIAREARNLNGKAILYGDKITPSMARAIEETERLREKQHAYNLANGIVPHAAACAESGI